MPAGNPQGYDRAAAMRRYFGQPQQSAGFARPASRTPGRMNVPPGGFIGPHVTKPHVTGPRVTGPHVTQIPPWFQNLFPGPSLQPTAPAPGNLNLFPRLAPTQPVGTARPAPSPYPVSNAEVVNRPDRLGWYAPGGPLAPQNPGMIRANGGGMNPAVIQQYIDSVYRPQNGTRFLDWLAQQRQQAQTGRARAAGFRAG